LSSHLLDPPLDWGALYLDHSARLRRVVARLVGEAMADDVIQDAFLRAYRNRQALDPSRPVGPWLTAIARRAAMDALRRERSAERARQSCESPRLALHPVEDAFFNTVVRAGIEQSLLALSERHRRLLTEDALGDVPRHRLAATEEVGGVALKSALARARRGFRDRYLELVEEAATGATGTSAGVRSATAR
jgi:RNA polymerase sigma-70 factor (ECF subfamily)